MSRQSAIAIGTSAQEGIDAKPAIETFIEFDDVDVVAPEAKVQAAAPVAASPPAELYEAEFELTDQQMELSISEIDTLLDMRRRKP